MKREIDQVIRGIPNFLLKEYLVELGGTMNGDDVVVGDGWVAVVTRLEPFRLFSLSVGQNRLQIEVDEEIADAFLDRFAMKTLRAGA